MTAFMTKKYSMPEAPILPSDGALSIKMSSPIQLYDAKTLVKNKRRNLDQDGKSKATELTKNEELMLVDSYMKLSGSIKVQLIPHTDVDVDKKGFSWKLAKYDEGQIGIAVKWQNPAYVSVGGIDKLKITFNNTKTFIKPKSDDFDVLPDGYNVMLDVLTQGEDIMSVEELKETKQSGQKIVIVSFIMSQVLKTVMSTIFGSIVIVQILAHLPLTDVFMPVNVI